MVYREAALAHHLLQVTIGELIPSDTQKDDGGLEVTPLERRLILLHRYGAERMMNELKSGL
jgi:hypothetical protein